MKRFIVSENRIGSVDFLKGLSIVGVVILHAKFESRFDLLALQVWEVLASVFGWAVLGFFFASGLMFRLDQSFSHVRLKAVVLLKAFIFYHVIYVVIISLLDASGIITSDEFTLSVRLSQFWNSIAFQLYFLPLLAVFMVSAAVVGKVAGEYWKWFACSVIFISALYYGPDRYPGCSHGPELTKWALYATSFVLGLLSKGCIRGGYQIGIPLTLALAFVAITRGKGWGLVIPLIVVGSIEFTKPRHFLTLIGAIGTSSGSIYLWHTPVLLPALTIIFFKLGVYPLINLVLSISLALLIPNRMRFLLSDWLEARYGWRCPRWITL
jgi:hypothetical protein